MRKLSRAIQAIFSFAGDTTSMGTTEQRECEANSFNFRRNTIMSETVQTIKRERQVFDASGNTGTRGAAWYLDIGDMQMSQLLRKGRIEGATKSENGEWVIPQDGLDKYQATKGQPTKGARAAGSRAVVVMATAEQFEQLKELGFNPVYKNKKFRSDGTDGASDAGSEGEEGLSVE
jgi:hypothetical protein